MSSWASRLRDKFDETGWKKAELGRRSGISYDNINKYLPGKDGISEIENPRGDTLEALATALKLDPVWLATGSTVRSHVYLVGKIGAGAEINLLNNDDFNTQVEAPPNCSPETIAVEVVGDSMFPAYEEGEILYYSQNLPPIELVNRRCVVKLSDGRIFVKVLRPGMDGRWNLESVNTSTPTMVDLVVEWVAKIEWTKPR